MSTENQLPIRATLTLRHDKILSGRKALGMSQAEFAEACGVNIGALQRLEKLDFTVDPKAIELIAGFLMLEPADLVPEEAQGKKFPSLFCRVQNVPMDTLALGCDQNRMIAGPTTESLAELRDVVQEALNKLPCRLRTVLELRYGLAKDDPTTYTLGEVGKILRITREAVRQLEMSAISKLQHPRLRKLFETFEREDTHEH